MSLQESMIRPSSFRRWRQARKQVTGVKSALGEDHSVIEFLEVLYLPRDRIADQIEISPRHANARVCNHEEWTSL